MNLVAQMPSDPNEGTESLPVDMKSYSVDTLRTLNRGCLEIVHSVLKSRRFQSSIEHIFATGDVSFVTTDYFSPIVEKLLLVASQNVKGMLSVYQLSPGVGEIVASALDGLLSALPLQYLTGIVEAFIKSKTEVTLNMLCIATDRLTRTPSSDIALKASLRQLLSIITSILESSEELNEMNVTLQCISQLSRKHGKAELPLFEGLVPVIVSRIDTENAIVVQRSLDCLSSMLYVTPKSF